MSNDTVGTLYNNVIEGVISQAQTDFEDNGVDQQVINELRSIWQKKLTEMNVAAMPWDPKPDETTSANGAPPQPPPPQGGGTESPAIKDELAMPSNNGNGPILPDSSNDGGGGLVLPGGGITQTDGSSDQMTTTGVPLTTQQIDKIVEHQLHNKHTNQHQQRMTINIVKDGDKHILLTQTDGADDDEDDIDQSDEINSDLDDPEDELGSGDDDDDDEQGMIMLCLYDKVQRVKNKWKYVLKDGIANINGKEYVFSRGSGESEW